MSRAENIGNADRKHLNRNQYGPGDPMAPLTFKHLESQVQQLVNGQHNLFHNRSQKDTLETLEMMLKTADSLKAFLEQAKWEAGG